LNNWCVALTEFGNIAVLMPLAGVLLLWLLLMHSPRGATRWAISVALCVALTAVLKLSFYRATADLPKPSGHTSFSTLVGGAMTLVTATESRGLPRIITISRGGFILAIAASRLLLHAHSACEVGLGLVIGTAALALFGRRYLRCRPAKVSLSTLFLIGGALMLVLYGREFDAKHVLRRVAGYLRIHCA
jgi:membrane-associated phospholipid phosphatase